MRIVSSRADEIRKERDEYRAQQEAARLAHEEERRAYGEAEDAVTAPIKEYLMYKLDVYTVLDFDVGVYRGGRSYNTIEVRIRCNERDIHSEESALSWNMDVELVYKPAEDAKASGDREKYKAAREEELKRDAFDASELSVRKETGSWSGLKATTPAQLKSLRQSVAALEFLNDLDWVSLLNKQLPKYEDYIHTRELPSREGEFSKRIAESQLEDLIGTNTLVKVQNFESSGYRGRTIFVRILRETPSQYVCNIMSEWEINRFKDGSYKLDDRYTQRVKKSNLVPVIENGEIVTVEI